MKKGFFLKSLLFTTCGLLMSIQGMAQDPEFSQFYAAPLYTNPAMAGTGQGCGGRITMNYRNQWPSLPGQFQTFAAGFDRHVDKLAGGIGFLVTSDRAGQGLLTTNTFSAMYSYHLQVNRQLALRFGVQAGVVQKSIDFSKLTFSDMIDSRSGFKYNTNEPLPANTKFFPNFSTGVLAYTDMFYGGVAVHNLIEPNQSFYNSSGPGTTLPRRFTAHGGVNIPIGGRSSDFTISPNILFMLQKQFTQVNFGLYINKSSFVTGLWYRQTRPNSDALMVLVGFKQGAFRFGYSYDITVSDARVAARGSHELSMSIDLKCRQGGRTIKKLVCPDF